MNLLAAIVLSNFAEMCKQEAYPISPDQVYSHPLLPLQFLTSQRGFGLTSTQLMQVQEYADVWGQFDPLCTNLIDYDQLPKLLRRLSPPLGFAHREDSEPTPGDAVDLFVQKQLPLAEDALIENKVHFVETFMSLVKFQYGMQVR